MNRYKIVNWSTKEELQIEALHWEIDPKIYAHVFYVDNNGKVIECAYGTRYWDIRGIEYDITASNT